jgi:hypothetical protein
MYFNPNVKELKDATKNGYSENSHMKPQRAAFHLFGDIYPTLVPKNCDALF